MSEERMTTSFRCPPSLLGAIDKLVNDMNSDPSILGRVSRNDLLLVFLKQGVDGHRSQEKGE